MEQTVIFHDDVSIGSALADVTAIEGSSVLFSFSRSVDSRVVCNTLYFRCCGKSISLSHGMKMPIT